MVEWMLLPTRSAIGRTPARSCTSISPGWYFALTSYLSLRPHLLLCFTSPAFDKVGVGPRHLRRLLLLLLDRRLPPSEKAPAACYAWQPCEIAAEELAHLRLIPRSEEHTSELQSRQYLVCRLL